MRNLIKVNQEINRTHTTFLKKLSILLHRKGCEEKEKFK